MAITFEQITEVNAKINKIDVKGKKNTALWSITVAALAGLVVAGCAQRMTTAVWIAAAACMAWIAMFLTVNRRSL